MHNANTTFPSRFFKLSQDPAKQIELRDPYENLALMFKLASKRKRVCLILQNINLCLNHNKIPPEYLSVCMYL